MQKIFRRGVRGALFDRGAFNEILFDSTAAADAAILVIAVALVTSIVTSVSRGGDVVGAVVGSIGAVIGALAGWLFLAFATWFAGTRLFDGTGNAQTVIACHGFAYLPNLLAIVALGTFGPGSFLRYVPLIGYLWSLLAAVVATSVALSQRTREAALSVLVGAAILFLISWLIGGTIGGIAGGFGFN